MKSALSSIFLSVFVLMASMLGMGFISGREILNFFNIHGVLGIFSCLIFFASFLFIMIIISRFLRMNNITSIGELNKILFKDISNFIKPILIFIYLTIASSMLAGLNSLFGGKIGVSFPIFSIILCCVAFLVIIGGMGRLKRVFSFLMPVIMMLFFLNVSVNIANINFNFFSKLEETTFSLKNVIKMLIFPLLFLGENFILSINIFITLKKRPLIPFLLSLIMTIFLILALIVSMKFSQFDMPLLESSKSLSPQFYLSYFLIIMLTIFNSYSVSIYNIKSTLNLKNFGTIISIIISLIISFLGFKFIIKYLYSLAGLFGILYILAVVIRIIIYEKSKY